MIMAAKLLHPYLFCTDINIKTLKSIVIYDDQHLLITSEYFIKRYNVSDRKQVNSWITKSWLPFTGGAVKDPTKEKIYAVINNSSICSWRLEEKDIENVKKNEFKSPIKALIPCKKKIYILYTCGFVEPLKSDLKRKKEDKKQIVKKDEEILEYKAFEEKNLVTLLVNNKNKEYFLYKVQIGSHEALACINIKLNNYSLTGSSIFSSGKLITSWSDGNLYSLNLLENDISFVPGNKKGKISSLESTMKIKILELSPNHIALQGMNINKEGGLVLLWDTKFGVSVSCKPLKMYRNPPLAWSVGSGIVVCDGGSLVYIPLSLTPSTVASMFGSHTVGNGNSCEERFEMSIGNNYILDNELGDKDLIKEYVHTIYSNKSTQLADVIKSFKQGSVSEDIIANLVISNLIEKRNMTLLSECLTAFKVIPERSLVCLLKFYLKLSEDQFVMKETKNAKNKKVKSVKGKSDKSSHNSKKKSGNTGVEEDALNSSLMNGGHKEDHKSKHEQELVCPYSHHKARTINDVLVQPFTVSEISKAFHLLDFNSSLSLMEYLHYLLASGQAPILEDGKDRNPTIEQSSLWLSLLLDANYHQLVMTSEVDIQRKLLTCFTDVTALRNFLESSHSLDTLVERVLSAKPLPVTQLDSPYSIERLVL